MGLEKERRVVRIGQASQDSRVGEGYVQFYE